MQGCATTTRVGVTRKRKKITSRKRDLLILDLKSLRSKVKENHSTSKEFQSQGV